MKTYTVRGTYGSRQTPCNVLCADTRQGTWYAVEGSSNVNLTPDPLEDGTDVETLPDVDTLTWQDGINSEEELQTAIDA